jgi:hypothetical protein
VDRGRVLHVIDRRVRDTTRKFPFAVANSIGPGKEYLATSSRRNIVFRESLDNGYTAGSVRSQRRTHFCDHHTLITVGNRNLFARRKH